MYDAGKFLIKHVFEILNLKSIHCVTSSENIGMQKVVGKLGVNLDGVRKEHLLCLGFTRRHRFRIN